MKRDFFRFSIASDLQYGKGTLSMVAENMVEWINAEKMIAGLDLFFINGDITHDEPGMLIQLRDKHLKNLDLPYYCIKGNHDYVDEKPESPTESWSKSGVIARTTL